ncbi:hypothetical protein KAFR_0A04770 [Kazachstania africana CBS 2517]|uniref:glucan 1,3-beta-glucosidase n=1 Tax=Kazachstania africana (strain ATCC 22294 / BCRC 22015 / CBS 2517 / CECT 1963 / NBRC 1671 / NRRL Y-8276) TaxID=1071382 RepID=H2ANG2_KAZAF|nr:hypothetical protein KAFR_0A04770 [Kazachstania africana CBS 2517]CCF55912.1 hypothetical protein KAFR_0A04770 [Kazachstania africana CBS 2517]
MILKLLFTITLFFKVISSTPVPPKSSDSVQFYEKRYYDYSANEPIRGLNIGGWLVLEPYITPSLFEAFGDDVPVDEYHYCQTLGRDEAAIRLLEHWGTFYTEEDFKQIASLGFNLVRIPVGYWAFKTLESDPYVSGVQEIFLDEAIAWSKKYGLKVWVDLHGAAGSQNGFDNSGLRDAVNFLNYSENINITSEVLEYILQKYSAESYADTIIGIELLNEPLGPSIDLDKLKNDYYIPAYDYLRNTLNSNQNIIIHDAFEAYNYWDDFLTLEDGAWGITIDHHHYQVFSTGELATTMDEKIQTACQWGTGVLSEAHWTVAGEFSAALTDCTKWLNGVGIGARYDGSYVKGSDTSYYQGSCDNNEDITSWSDERKQNTRRFIEAQLDAFEMRGGWIFWCYKTETSIEWDASRLIEYGLFPQPLTDRQYPGQCSN